MRGCGRDPGPGQRSSLCGALALCGARASSLTGVRASLEELLVGKRIVGLAAIAKDDVVDDGDAEELAGVHQALGQRAVFLAGLRRPGGMIMAAEQGRGIAQDRRLRRVGCWRGNDRFLFHQPPSEPYWTVSGHTALR